VQGRATQGVKVINLEKRNDTIASVCCVDSDPEEELGDELNAESADAIPETGAVAEVADLSAPSEGTDE
ncbi:MAG: hypothetical protein K2G01_05005, partial [Paramuribaculum sp.]|nr:hypothetical protein [Paramuribaculum sp.]